jgi:hypothetical protein
MREIVKERAIGLAGATLLGEKAWSQLYSKCEYSHEQMRLGFGSKYRMEPNRRSS